MTHTHLKWLYLLLLGLASCSENSPSSTASTTADASTITPPTTPTYQSTADTIVEKNNPLALDLSKHQIFIDTTRNSAFYMLIKHWKPSKWDHLAIDAYLEDIQPTKLPNTKPPKHFPTHFISLRKFNGEWILYDRCDGIDQRFEIRDSAFVFYGPLESHAASLLQVTTKNKQSLSMTLKPDTKASNNAPKAFVTIQQKTPFIYQITYSLAATKQVIYATTPEHIEQFDLLVNHCPKNKRSEFSNFDPLSTYTTDL